MFEGLGLVIITSPVWLPMLFIVVGLILISYNKKKAGKIVVILGVLFGIVGMGMCSDLLI